MQKTLILSFCLALFLQGSFAYRAVLAGGGLSDDNADVYQAFIDLATPAGKQPYIGIITAASSTAQDNGAFYVNLFQKTYGVQNVEWLPIDINNVQNAQSPVLAAKLANMTGVWFGGGDQENLMTCFYRNGTNGQLIDTLTLSVIRARFNANLLAIGGTSAGTDIQQGAPMITGGESWNALLYGAYPYVNPKDEDDGLTYDPRGGFGFFKAGFVDTHCGTRGRQGRMIRLINDLKKNGTWGLCIDEDTAIVIQDNNFQVVGYNGVWAIDLSNSSPSNNGSYFSIKNVSIAYLTKGDQLNLINKNITWASWKNNIRGKEQHDFPMRATTDIFSSPNNYKNGSRVNPEMFNNVTTDLFDSAKVNTTYGLTYETHPEFRVDFDKSLGLGMVGNLGTTRYISYANLQVEILVERNAEEDLEDLTLFRDSFEDIEI